MQGLQSQGGETDEPKNSQQDVKDTDDQPQSDSTSKPIRMASGYAVRLLPDIERGPTWTEEYRMLCEARMLITWPRYRRQEYYEKIQKRRGETYAKALIAAVRQAYEEYAQ